MHLLQTLLLFLFRLFFVQWQTFSFVPVINNLIPQFEYSNNLILVVGLPRNFLLIVLDIRVTFLESP